MKKRTVLFAALKNYFEMRKVKTVLEIYFYDR